MNAQAQINLEINQEETKITWEDILNELPKTTSLYYVDYRDSFDENHKEIQDSIQSGSFEPLDNIINDWDDFESIDYFIDELKRDLNKNFDEEDIEEAIETYKDEIEQILRERDDSTPFKDLCRNTSDIVMFYDTGYEVDGDSWCWGEAKLRLQRYLIKKHLGIVSTTMYDQRIEAMLQNASYGGQLVVYFHGDIETLIPAKGQFNTLRFRNAHIAVIDTYGGSGADCHLNKSEFTLPFNAERIFVDKTIKYNYTFSVCGMSSNWCAETDMILENTDQEQKELPISDLAAIQARDKAFAAKWDNGKGECSFGDMDITRHRNTLYINDYPCGNKCTSCGTFWID